MAGRRGGVGGDAGLDQTLDNIIAEHRRGGGRGPSGSSGREPPSTGRGGYGGREPRGGGRSGRGGGTWGEMADHRQPATVLNPADGVESWPTWLTGKLIMARRAEVIRTWKQSPCICFRNNQM
jgi:hypothetical protein